MTAAEKETGLRASVIFQVVVVAACFHQSSFAAHPLETEDSSTQGEGNLELENGLSTTRSSSARVFLYQPQITFGLSSSLDVILQPSWLRSSSTEAGTTQGLGDTNLDAKWRFYGFDPWALALRAGMSVATSQRRLGMPHGDVAAHALLVGTFDAAPVVFHGNLGIARSPASTGQRSTIGHVSGAVMWSFNERLVLTVDAGTESDTDATRRTWPATVLAGAVYTLRPGLDFDVGYQTSLRGSSPTRKWLAGLTYRFAP